MASEGLAMMEGGISATLLAFLNARETNGIFTGLTMTALSAGWYHPLTPVESFLIGTIILQVYVLSYLQILPINLNSFFRNGLTIGKRRRRSTFELVSQQIIVLEKSLKLVRKLDKYDCVLRSLCEIQLFNLKSGKPEERYFGHPHPHNFAQENLVLNTLLRLLEEKHVGNGKIAENQDISEFEEAVRNAATPMRKLGTRFSSSNITASYSHLNEGSLSQNSCDTCTQKYPNCPLAVEDFIFYTNQMN